MTFFNLPNGYSATIQEGLYASNLGIDYRFKVTVKNAAGQVEEYSFCPALSDAMECLASY